MKAAKDWDGDTPLSALRAYLTQVVFREGKGTKCPCCGQTVNLYRNSISGTTASQLIAFYHAGDDWNHVPTVIGYGGHFTQLRFWGLIEPMEGEREDGS